MLDFQGGRATTDGHHLDSVLTHHKDAPHLLQIKRQQRRSRWCILQQYYSFLRNLPRSIVMGLGTEETIRLVTVHRSAIEQAQYTAYFFVEFLCSELPFLDEAFVSLCHVVVVVGIGGPHRQTVCPRAEFEIETVSDGFLCVVAAAPVADDHAIETPVVLQNLVQEDIIMTIVLVFVEVIGTHDGPSTALLHGSLEGGQINLVEGTVADNDIHLMTILFIIVQRIVFHTGGNTL